MSHEAERKALNELAREVFLLDGEIEAFELKVGKKIEKMKKKARYLYEKIDERLDKNETSN